jgi:HlyD family secretion protein/epimerase transport system membrane fusion protein
MDQITNQLDQVRVELATTSERLFASKDILNRTTIRSPIAGKVVNLRFKTDGGVVQKGEPIMDIVPSDDLLLIDARISPNDIDVVHTGLPAQVHLLAYANRTAPRISGVVKSVSADRLVDEITHQSYYLARVEVDREEIRRNDPTIELVPGMPAEVLIVTGEQTLVEYLIKPFTDALRRSLREG